MTLLTHTSPRLQHSDQQARLSLSEVLRLVTPLLVSSDPAPILSGTLVAHNPYLEMAGIFEDDPLFDRIEAEREAARQTERDQAMFAAAE